MCTQCTHLLIGVEEVVIALEEPLLRLEGPDGGYAVQRLAEERVDRGARCVLQTRQLTRCLDVVPAAHPHIHTRTYSFTY